MKSLNYDWFTYLNASIHSPQWLLWIAHILAVYAIFVVPLILIIGWMRRDHEQHRCMLRSLLSCIVALLLNQLITHIWYSPRPFVVPIGHTFLHHDPDSSFPSDHMTVVMTAAFSLVYGQQTRKMGITVFILGILIGWSRVYLGVHFPMDMLGGIAVAFISATLAYVLRRFYMDRLYTLARGLYRFILHPLIQRGWIHR